MKEHTGEAKNVEAPNQRLYIHTTNAPIRTLVRPGAHGIETSIYCNVEDGVAGFSNDGGGATGNHFVGPGQRSQSIFNPPII